LILLDAAGYDPAMVVFELPSKHSRCGLRAALFGSCRFRHPVASLHDTGDLRICNWGLKEVHNISETRQSLDYIEGALRIPDALAPYVIDLNHMPDAGHLARALRQGIDLFVTEISDFKDITYRDIVFQQNFFVRRFIQPNGEALLPWFRALSRGGEVADDEVTAALDRLRAAGLEAGNEVEDILRRTSLVRHDAEHIARTLSQMTLRTGRPWLVIGAITVPDLPGALMRNRRALNEHLAEACRRLGLLFHDPTKLISDHGRECILDANGANLYELAPDIYPFVGHEMLRLIRLAGGEAPPASASGAPISPRATVIPTNQDATRRADRINAALVALHRERLRRMGSTDSGLYAHYERLLEQEAIVGPRERAAMALLEAHTPDYPLYAVLRAGLGELAFLIAASGRRVHAFEPNPRRRAAIEAGIDHLQSIGLIEAGAVSVAAALSPTSAFTAPALGVALDASEVRDEAAAAPHMARMAQFSALLIDPRLFLRVRPTNEEEEGVLADLAGLGFNRRRDYFGDRLVLLSKDRLLDSDPR
jgi:hypothetical protein